MQQGQFLNQGQPQTLPTKTTSGNTEYNSTTMGNPNMVPNMYFDPRMLYNPQMMYPYPNQNMGYSSMQGGNFTL